MILISYDGIEGQATAEGYANHIRADSIQFGVGRGITMEPGNLANREATRPSLSEVTFTHVTDSSATALFKEAVTGSKGKKVVIKFIKTGSDGGDLPEFMSYTLYDVLVSGYSISAGRDGDVMESISLSYSKIEVKYNDFDKSNSSGSPKIVGYDLAAAKSL